MTDQEILKAAIAKVCRKEPMLKMAFEIAPLNLEELIEGGYVAIIFDHDFAKAFFGEEEMGWMDEELNLEGDGKPFKAWQYHLRKMAIYEEDGKAAPLKYLEKFI